MLPRRPSHSRSAENPLSHALGQLTPTTRRLLDGFELDQVTSHLLRRAHFMAEELFHSEFAEESLTPRQKAALIITAKHPGLKQNELAERLFMDRNTVADMVKRLCFAGLLLRKNAEEDQRAYQLFPTAEGVQMLNRVLERDAALEHRLLERLPAEYRPLFMKCLKLLLEPAGDMQRRPD
ncbi:hypothetical protein D9M70_469480 [compost metagenome]